LDTSWKGLTRPGDACDHFGGGAPPPFFPDATEFNLGNAFWLSEISRLIYRRDINEAGECPAGPSRRKILAGVGMREALFLSRQETQCALLRSGLPHWPPFAVLVFRGTTGWRNWFLDLDVRPERVAPRTVVHRGFMEAINQIWQDLEPHLKKLVEPLFITGHSMGGALAQLAAWHHRPEGVYTFGAPRVGDAGFAAGMAAIPTFCLVNNRDVVTVLPPSSQRLSFKTAGKRIHIDRRGRTCEMEENDMSENCWESGRMSLPVSEDRWFSPPQFLVDHAPINYSAKIQSVLQTAQTSPSPEAVWPPAGKKKKPLRTPPPPTP